VIDRGNRLDRAEALARELAADGSGRGPAYAGVVDAELALDRGDTRDAIETLEAVIKSTDLWLARFVLGTAYLQSERYADAVSQFEMCRLRADEATAVFFDDVPSLRYLSALNYWVARARDGLRRNVAITGR
jgi:hypothetical protein